MNLKLADLLWECKIKYQQWKNYKREYIFAFSFKRLMISGNHLLQAYFYQNGFYFLSILAIGQRKEKSMIIIQS